MRNWVLGITLTLFLIAPFVSADNLSQSAAEEGYHDPLYVNSMVPYLNSSAPGNTEDILTWNGTTLELDNAEAALKVQPDGTLDVLTSSGDIELQPAGNVSVGVDNPSKAFVVNGSGNFTQTVYKNNSEVATEEYVINNTLLQNQSVNVSGPPGAVQFTNGTKLDGDGNFTYNKTTGRLGVGTTTPNGTLTVQGQAENAFVVENGTGANVVEVDTANGTLVLRKPGEGEVRIRHDGSNTVDIQTTTGDLTSFNFGSRPRFAASDKNVFSIRDFGGRDADVGIIPSNSDSSLGVDYAMWDYLFLDQSIQDTNSNELLNFTPVSSAENNLNVENAPNQTAPVLSTVGDDANINLALATRGDGNITLRDTTKVDGVVATTDAIIKPGADDTAVALGDVPTVAGTEGATAICDGCVVQGNDGATALGQGGYASGNAGSTKLGDSGEANGETSFVMGDSVIAQADHSYIFGTSRNFNKGFKNTIPYSFMIGFQSNRSTFYADNNSVGIGGITNQSTATFEVNGTGRFRGNVNATSGNDICIEGEKCLSNATTNQTLNAAGEDGAVQFSYDDALDGNASLLKVNKSTGRTGVNTASPSATLDVEYEGGTGQTDPATIQLRNTNDGTARIFFDEDNDELEGGSDGAMELGYDGGANHLYVAKDGAPPSFVVERDDEDVGIGTSSPNASLDVNGTSTLIGNVGIGTQNTSSHAVTLQQPGDGEGLLFRGYDDVGETGEIEMESRGAFEVDATKRLVLEGGNRHISLNDRVIVGDRVTDPAGAIEIDAGDFSGELFQISTGANNPSGLPAGDMFTVENDGDVGIATPTPEEDLDVNGSTRIRSDLDVSDTNGSQALYVNASNGNVGVGTQNTSEQLTIAGNNSILFTSTSPQNKTTEIFADDTDSLNVRYQGGSGKDFNIKSGTTTVANFRAESTGHRIYGDLSLEDGLSVDSNQLVVDESSDKVGVNTTSPSADLDVAGDAEVTENLDVDGNVSVGDSITDSSGDRRIEMKNDKVVINLG